MAQRHLFALVMITSLSPFAASAQEFSGGVTLGFGNGDVSDLGLGIDSVTVDGRIHVELGGGFSFGARADYAEIDIDGLGAEVSGNLVGLDAAYAFSNGAWMGVYTENADIGISGLPINIGTTAYGIEGGYKSGNFDIGAFIGHGADLDHMGLSARYAPSSQFTLGVSASRSDLSLGGPELSLNYVGLAGVYDVTDKVSLFAGIGRTSISDVDADITTYGLGVGYDMSAMVNMPLNVSLELARSDLSAGGGGTDFDTVRLGISIPFGNDAGAKAPMNSVADAVLNPSHSAISQTVLMAF